MSTLAGCLSIVGVVTIPFGCIFLVMALASNWVLGVAFLGGLIWLGLMSTGIMMWQTRDHPEERSAGRVLSMMLMLFGILATTSFALVMVLVVACTAGILR